MITYKTYWLSLVLGKLKNLFTLMLIFPTKVNLILRDTDYPKNLTALILLKE